MIENTNYLNLKPHNYKEKSFKFFENNSKKTESNDMFLDVEKHRLETFNAMLDTIGLSKEDYYIEGHTEFGYSIYRKDSHNFNILFMFLKNRAVFKIEQIVYGHDLNALSKLESDIKESLIELPKNFDALPFDLANNQYLIKDREQDFNTYMTQRSFTDHHLFFRRNQKIHPDDLSFKMTEYEASAKYKATYTIRKEYYPKSIEVTKEFICLNIIFHRDFGVELNKEDFYFIKSLNIDCLSDLDMKRRKEIIELKKQGFFEFNENGILTDDSKKILKINFQI